MPQQQVLSFSFLSIFNIFKTVLRGPPYPSETNFLYYSNYQRSIPSFFFFSLWSMYKLVAEEARYMLHPHRFFVLPLLRTGSDQPQIVQIPSNKASKREKTAAAGGLIRWGRRLGEHHRFLHFEVAHPNSLPDSLNGLGVSRVTGGVRHIKHILSHVSWSWDFSPCDREPILPECSGYIW